MIRSISAKPAPRSVAVSNGTAPIINSYSMTPSEYTSESSSMAPVIVSACSGLAYSGVPTIWPNSVSSVFSTAHLSVAFAMPKSITLGTGVPSCSVTSTFDGFRSRWIAPFWCACWTARQIARNNASRSLVVKRLRSQYSVIGAPSMYSITKYGRPLLVAPASKIRAMFGWSIIANA